jgi:hypothetical protein
MNTICTIDTATRARNRDHLLGSMPVVDRMHGAHGGDGARDAAALTQAIGLAESSAIHESSLPWQAMDLVRVPAIHGSGRP